MGENRPFDILSFACFIRRAKAVVARRHRCFRRRETNTALTAERMNTNMLPIIGAIAGLLTTVVSGVTDNYKRKQELKKAVMENRMRLAASERECNHEWEMKQLEQAGWKDDVLFYAWLGFFVWSGICPDRARVVIDAWETLPPWFLEITFWIVAAVLGVKKIGDYLPGTIRGVRDAFRGIK